MRLLLYLSLIIVFGCEKMNHTESPEKPICEHQEFHGTFLQNNICIFPDIIAFKKEGELLNFLFSKKGLYNENIQFSVHHKSNLQDTLFFETIGIINIGRKANILFSYSEGPAIVGEWEIPKNKGTKKTERRK